MTSLLADLHAAVDAVLREHGALERRDAVFRAITDQVASASQAEEQRFLSIVCQLFNADLVVS